MKHKKKILALTIGISLLIGGCGVSESGNNQNGDNNSTEGEQNKNIYASVQDYTGQGYTLKSGEKTDEIAEDHREEIDKAVKEFFMEEYKTEVKVHNTVGAVDGASVFVESVGEPHFYTFAVVPIDTEKGKVLTDQVWAQEGQVEAAIRGGLYGLIFEEGLQKLDNYLKEFTSKHPVVGVQEEKNENVGGAGYMTPYYYITIFGESFDPLYKMYLENPDRSKEEWVNALNEKSVNPDEYNITIQLFMEEPNVDPDKEIFNQIVSDLENMNGLPPASYSVYLNDNRIHKSSGTGTQDNSLVRSNPNYIIKDLEKGDLNE
ncbi:DUF1672 family protein [Halobacillus hunanensis]|uniref:DUF1672 family protein n=1 Tax=Halobacillus hunanensis TaxID=578214 RepID=UPI0009A61CE7|nr:DUF1672 family protein [Halobacillus hunanensis]